MARMAALLRGINLGSRNRVAMPELRELVGELGYENVETLLQSGNVVFDADDRPEEAAERVSEAIAARLGLDIPVVVRTARELAAVVRRDPLGEVANEPKRYHVMFLSGRPPAAAVRELDPQAFEPELFRIHGREVYVWMPSGAQGARLSNAFWERRFRVISTARNWNTVEALAGLTAG